MSLGKPPAIRECTHADHPARRHGHYGYGGRYWCSDFGSPLLGEENMGHVERGWIVIFEKRDAECPHCGTRFRQGEPCPVCGALPPEK